VRPLLLLLLLLPLLLMLARAIARLVVTAATLPLLLPPQLQLKCLRLPRLTMLVTLRMRRPRPAALIAASVCCHC
jgi:hypothetical protein